MEHLRFTIPEIISLFGLAQCVYVMVYMVFRAGDYKRAAIPFFYFLVLGIAFFLDFAARFVAELSPNYETYRWAAWFLGPPLSVLLIVQVARISKIPSWPYFSVLLFIPLCWLASIFMAPRVEGTNTHDWFMVAGLIAGALSFLIIWARRAVLEDLYQEKAGKERYWLILTLIFVNLFFLLTMLLGLTPLLNDIDALMIRSVLGLGLIYLASTSLFRIYPQAMVLVSPKQVKSDLTSEEIELGQKIKNLLDMDKIYQEPKYDRTELARELQTSERVISRVINIYFDKSFPQLFNEHRVEDAKRMLTQTDASIKVIAYDVGFNSTASFNRIFRNLTGVTPTDYRSNST